MNLFNYYRISFVLSFLLLIVGSMTKVTHIHMKIINAETIIAIGLFSSVGYIAIAFYMMYKSQKMPMGEKLIWVVLFALGFITKIGLITFLTAVVFFFLGPRRLLYKTCSNGNS